MPHRLDLRLIGAPGGAFAKSDSGLKLESNVEPNVEPNVKGASRGNNTTLCRQLGNNNFPNIIFVLLLPLQ